VYTEIKTNNIKEAPKPNQPRYILSLMAYFCYLQKKSMGTEKKLHHKVNAFRTEVSRPINSRQPTEQSTIKTDIKAQISALLLTRCMFPNRIIYNILTPSQIYKIAQLTTEN